MKLQNSYNEVRRVVAPYDKERYFASKLTVIKQKILAGVFSLDNARAV